MCAKQKMEQAGSKKKPVKELKLDEFDVTPVTNDSPPLEFESSENFGPEPKTGLENLVGAMVGEKKEGTIKAKKMPDAELGTASQPDEDVCLPPEEEVTSPFTSDGNIIEEDFTEIKTPVVDVEATEEELKGPSLELTEEVVKEILDKQDADDLQRAKNKASTVNYDNGMNLWRLIFKSENETLGFSKVVLAMAMGKSGVLILVSDTQDYKTVLSTEYAHDCTLQLVKGKGGEDDKYIIK